MKHRMRFQICFQGVSRVLLLLVVMVCWFEAIHSADAAVGAATPFTCFEAEGGRIGGGATIRYLTNAPATEFSSAELEASGHAFVELNSTGEFVEWTNTTPQAVTFVNLRYCIPDAPTGGGTDATLDLYVNGVFRQALNLTSRQTWLYENGGNYGGNEQNPTNGNPRVFFDDRHAFITGDPIAPGSVIQLRKGSTNNAAFYYLDVIDLETPPAPLPQPANSLSILSYGAVADNPAFDSTTALQNCFNAAQAQGKSVWIPPGTFYLKTKAGLNATGITIEGAGMWYSTIYRDVPLPNDSPLGAVLTMTSCTVRNFAVDANAPSRAVVDGCGGAMDITGNYWLAEGIWTQHTMSGFWASGIGGMVRNCRLISIWADGCNLNNVAVSGVVGNYLTASNNFVRGTGDDALAINSVNYNENNGNYTYYLPMTNATFINNTTIGAWGGKGLAIYGGSGHLVKDNYTSDTARYIGLGVGKFGVNGSDLLSATVVGNVVVRSGGNGFQQQQQALMIGNDGDGQGVGSVVNAYVASNTIMDSVFAAVGLSTSSNIVFQHNTILNPAREGIVVGMYALRPGLGNAILYSNTVVGLQPGFAVVSNSSSTYALITPRAAVNFNGNSGVAAETCSEGGQNLGQLESGDWTIYQNVDLGGKDSFVVRVASGGLGGSIEIRLNNSGGTLLGICQVPPTGGWQSYVNVYASITNPGGLQTVCLVFIGGSGRLFNLQHFGFFSTPPIQSQQLVVGNTYALKSVSNGKYVGVSTASGGVLLANQNSVSPTEQFQILDAGGGRVGLRSIGSNTIVCAENAGAAPLVANRTGLGAWETFSQFQTAAGLLGLRAEINGRFVGFQGATNALIANTTQFSAAQDFLVEFVAGVAPVKPGGLRAVPGDGRVTLTWAGATGATGYYVKRSATDGGPYATIATNNANGYVDTSVINAFTYYYVVSAFNPAGESTNSNQVTVVPGALDRLNWVVTALSSGPGDPVGNSIDGKANTRWATGAQQVNGQWLQVDMAVTNTINKVLLDASASPSDYPRGYRVNLSMDGVNWGAAVATGAGSAAVTSITFSQQAARYVRITQTGSAPGLWWSVHELNIFGTAGLPPAPPDGLTAVSGDGQATLSWNSVPGASGYNLKYATVPSGPFLTIATNTPALELIAAGLVNGSIYYFTVSALNAAGESTNAGPMPVRPIASEPPPLSITPGLGQLELNWPATHTGWLLQTQTNAAGMGLGTNWNAIAESANTNRILRAIDPAQGSVFFRLVRP